MRNDASKTGYLSVDEIEKGPGTPSASRRRKGAVAILECLEDIPCNPCEASCKVGAISVGEDITTPPHLDGEKCVGCRTCVPICPGQAIFILDESVPDNRATVEMPYEYLPLPEKGETVTALDRSGQEIGQATITAVRNTPKMDQTATVTINVPREWSMTARAIRVNR